MDQDKTVMFAELWGHVYDNSGWFRVATDATIYRMRRKAPGFIHGDMRRERRPGPIRVPAP